ncbi:LuxR C-terminal-related transcriptional regulator [Kitasatospora sp. NPDC050543]|uniref:LuxR C-terminal-related transcriptional regulator n=1 Tax=Kitasatospora sp. NPDC050543 TaxID=3364054 RepID=UPI0037B7B512
MAGDHGLPPAGEAPGPAELVPGLPGTTLPDLAARELYREILREGGRILVRDVEPGDAGTVERLLELGLVVLNIADASYSAVNPRAVSSRISADLRALGTRLLTKAEELPALLDELTQAYDAAPRRTDRSSRVRHIEGMEQIRHLVIQLTEDHPQEALAAQPGGARPERHLADSLDRTRRYLERGGAMRSIYEPAARADAATAEFAARATRLGARIRVLNQPFKRLLVFDRTVAVIPARADNASAAFIEDPATVDFLVGVFEQHWQQAEGTDWTGAAGGGEPLVHQQTGRLLAQGLTQRAIASRLGLSERTVAGHISRLRELYDAETLFQLGWQMRGAGVESGD